MGSGASLDQSLFDDAEKILVVILLKHNVLHFRQRNLLLLRELHDQIDRVRDPHRHHSRARILRKVKKLKRILIDLEKRLIEEIIQLVDAKNDYPVLRQLRDELADPLQLRLDAPELPRFLPIFLLKHLQLMNQPIVELSRILEIHRV